MDHSYYIFLTATIDFKNKLQSVFLLLFSFCVLVATVPAMRICYESGNC